MKISVEISKRIDELVENSGLTINHECNCVYTGCSCASDRLRSVLTSFIESIEPQHENNHKKK